MIEKISRLEDILKERVLVLDGAMGTMIQSYNLNEDDYRGNDWKNVEESYKGIRPDPGCPACPDHL